MFTAICPSISRFCACIVPVNVFCGGRIVRNYLFVLIFWLSFIFTSKGHVLPAPVVLRPSSATARTRQEWTVNSANVLWILIFEQNRMIVWNSFKTFRISRLFIVIIIWFSFIFYFPHEFRRTDFRYCFGFWRSLDLQFSSM